MDTLNRIFSLIGIGNQKVQDEESTPLPSLSASAGESSSNSNPENPSTADQRAAVELPTRVIADKNIHGWDLNAIRQEALLNKDMSPEDRIKQIATMAPQIRERTFNRWELGKLLRQAGDSTTEENSQANASYMEVEERMQQRALVLWASLQVKRGDFANLGRNLKNRENEFPLLNDGYYLPANNSLAYVGTCSSAILSLFPDSEFHEVANQCEKEIFDDVKTKLNALVKSWNDLSLDERFYEIGFEPTGGLEASYQRNDKICESFYDAAKDYRALLAATRAIENEVKAPNSTRTNLLKIKLDKITLPEFRQQLIPAFLNKNSEPVSLEQALNKLDKGIDIGGIGVCGPSDTVTSEPKNKFAADTKSKKEATVEIPPLHGYQETDIEMGEYSTFTEKEKISLNTRYPDGYKQIPTLNGAPLGKLIGIREDNTCLCDVTREDGQHRENKIQIIKREQFQAKKPRLRDLNTLLDPNVFGRINEGLLHKKKLTR